ncbi:MAG: molecular chaperone TorD family protein [Chloroflexi bacterium]|nr:molecular chaperone TorD family protein [Chloroflexota bacterium]
MAIATIVSWQLPLARSAVYEALSVAFLYPAAGVRELLLQEAAGTAEAVFEANWPELARASEALAAALASVSDDALLEQYIDIFGHGVSKDCPQYEGEYDETHIFLKSQTLAGLSAFYTAFGVAPNPELRDRLDHISVEMEFMHLLTTKEAYALYHGHGEDKVSLCQQAQQGFLTEHLAPWIKSFIKRVGRKAGQGSPYAAAISLLEAHMKAEFGAFGVSPAPSRQVIIPLEEEEAAVDCDECPLDASLP